MRHLTLAWIGTLLCGLLPAAAMAQQTCSSCQQSPASRSQAKWTQAQRAQAQRIQAQRTPGRSNQANWNQAQRSPASGKVKPVLFHHYGPGHGGHHGGHHAGHCGCGDDHCDGHCGHCAPILHSLCHDVKHGIGSLFHCHGCGHDSCCDSCGCDLFGWLFACHHNDCCHDDCCHEGGYPSDGMMIEGSPGPHGYQEYQEEGGMAEPVPPPLPSNDMTYRPMTRSNPVSVLQRQRSAQYRR